MTLSDKTKQSFEEIYNGALKIYENENELKNWLRFQLNLKQYSPLNKLYLYQQDPNATFVAGFNKWKQLGHPVKEKGCLHVMSPILIKGFYNADNVWRPLKSATDIEKVQIENGTLKKRDIIKDYRFIPVFDISKTDATIDDLVGEMTEKKNKDINVDELYQNLSAYLEKESPSRTSEGKIHDLVSGYVSDLVKSNDSFDMMADTTDVDSLRALASESITYCVLNYFNVDDTLFKFRSLSHVTWNKENVEDLMKMNKYICTSAESVVEDLSEAFM